MNPNVAELARLCSYSLTRRWSYPWADFEAELGIVLPSEYKEYAAYFPPGRYGGALLLEHPAIREGNMTFPQRIRFLADTLRDWPVPEREPMPFYPDSGGLIPWAAHESVAALCWLPEVDDPDRWPVIAASDENRYERIPGTTIEALISVLRGEAGRAALPDTFYLDLDSYGPFDFNADEDPSPDVDLPQPDDTAAEN